MAKSRFFIDCDDAGDWYLIPEVKREEWNLWLETDWKSSLSDCVLPSFVVDIDEPKTLTFTDPLEQ